ncbi:MAG: WD40 repeat domain-containing serine/threonine protein kinase [Opitutus sp.]
MPPSRQDETLIAQLLDLPPVERAAALERACAANPALREGVFDILAALAAAEQTAISSSVSDLAPDAVARVLESALEVGPAELSGTRIGPYKLLEEIGEGGFGVVWMAEQAEPIRRRVALKILKVGMDTREVIARFEAERQALALMDHPNIARVFDAGATEKGRPYFVMELVRGVAITRYCDQNRLSAEARLKLFMTVCQAVQHAHHKGVIHRDLKPSNILVTLHDGMPVPKVIDFGIAKATQGRLTDKTLFTQFHTFMGTPAYTSPEQMEMSGLDVDTRSDIYSLGVVLYELLTGQPPFNPDALEKAGLESMRRTIREVDPPRPSRRLSTLTEQVRTTVAHQRSTDVGKLSLLLRGDLDWVVMHCLEKDRTRRYETANGLARDIERHLNNEPVAARPPTGAYRLQKFVRRHKVAFVAVTAVVLSLVAGLITSSVLLVRERLAHTRAVGAEREQTRLRQQADSARVQETKRASRTALDLAGQLLEKGQTAEALAYMVHAARKDPANATIAPRLASVLTSHNFLLPESAPFQCRSRVLAMRFTNDGRSLLVGTMDGTFRVFDADSGGLLREYHLGKPVMRGGWIFARDNDACFAVRFADNTAGVFDISSGHLRWPPIHLDSAIALEASLYTNERSSLSLSPDARWLSALGLNNRFWLWDATTGESRMHLSFPNWFFGPDFSPDGRRLVLVSGESVQIWSLPECTPFIDPIRLAGTTGQGMWLIPHFSPDGRRLAIFDPWQGIHMFDATSGASLGPMIRRHYVDPSLADFLPDGRVFLGHGQSAELLDLETGASTKLAVEGSGRKTTSADGKVVLTMFEDGVARVWAAATGRLLAEPTLHEQDRYCAALSPEGMRIAVGTAMGAIRRLHVGRGAARPLVLRNWAPLRMGARFLEDLPARILLFKEERASVVDVASGREVAGGFAYPQSGSSPLHDPENLSFDIRPDLKFVVARNVSGREATQVWEITSNGDSKAKLLQGDSGSPKGYVGVPFSPVGDLVAHVKQGGLEIGVWNLNTGAPVGSSCAYHGQPITLFPGIAFSEDGKRIAGGLENGEVIIWDIASGIPATFLQTHTDASCQNVYFSRDGSRVLAENNWGEISLWNSTTGERAGPVISGVGYNLAFSSDGRWYGALNVASVSIRDGHTASPVSRMMVKGALDFHFSREGERIVTTNSAGVAQVWDVLSGQALSDAMQHATGDLQSLEFSPGGHFVGTISRDKAQVWSVPPPLPVGQVIPEWLLKLAEICSTKTINDAEQCVDYPEAVAQIDDVRSQLATLPADAPYVEWGRWLLDDSPTRSIAPGFTITPEELEKFAGSVEKRTATP